jgi:uncharacterized protein YeaO (DUF488 family)
VDLWIKDAGASPGLRIWLGHDTAKWEEFRRRYHEEIQKRPEVINKLIETIHTRGTVTFLYAARDTEHKQRSSIERISWKKNMRIPFTPFITLRNQVIFVPHNPFSYL